MNEKEIVKAAMNSVGWTQQTLAENCGYMTQSCVGSRLAGKSMRVDTFIKFLGAMGYEVVVQSKNPTVNKNKWVVEPDREEGGSK